MRCVNNQTPLIGVTHSLRADGFDASEDGTGRGTPLVPIEPYAFPWQQGGTLGMSGTLVKNQTMAVAIAENQKGELRISDVNNSLAQSGGKPGQGYAAALVGMQVRRLTPTESERLQGFPDNYTAITVKGKPAADGPRYKALGNSMAVPCMRWIGERIQRVEDLGHAKQNADQQGIAAGG